MKLGFKKSLIRPGEQKGLASIIIVAVLVVLLSLISIGFARLMDRAVSGSLNNQLSSSASYAAQSAINDTIAYLQANPNASATKCNDILGAPGGISANFSGNSDYKYTCILVNPTPPTLTYSLPPSQSQVAKVSPATGTLDSLLFSWQASDGTKNSPTCSGLETEAAWTSANCPPLLRVTLYPVDASSNVSQSNSHTYFLYPSSGGSLTFGYNTADGSIVPVKCNSTLPTGYAGPVDKLCNVSITGLAAATSAQYFYVRLTSIYEQSTSNIRGNDSANNPLEFKGDQSLIDVTAQAGTAVKRLQASVSINKNDILPAESALPEDGLRSAEAICKRLDVGATVTVQGTLCQNQLIINQPPPPAPPTVNFCVDNGSDCSAGGYSSNTTTIADSSAATLRWSISNVSSCNTTGSSLGWGGPSGDGTAAVSTGELSGGSVGGPGQSYTYTINCTGPGGSVNGSVTINVSAPTGNQCTDNCGPPGGQVGGCTDYGVSVDSANYDPSSGNFEYTAHMTGDNSCGVGIAQCDIFTPTTTYEDDFGNAGSVDQTDNVSNYPDLPNWVEVGCEAEDDSTWGYYYGGGGSNPGSPSTPVPYWISKGISYFGVRGGSPSSGINSWCQDGDASHHYFVCGVWVVGNGSLTSCNLGWSTDGGNSYFIESQYNGVTDTPGGSYNGAADPNPPSPTPPGFVLGFPGSSYVIQPYPDPNQLKVSCNNLNDWIWNPPVPPIG